ncbi:MAG: heavy-metal-associated domain-containing protein [Gemmatimonadaceae bacterium]
MLKSTTFEVIGEHRLACEGCENRVARLLEALKGVERVRARASSQRIDVQFDPAMLDTMTITERLRSAGYETQAAPSTASQPT